ncbi:LamG-like jellyroll fold domain-containing protein [Cryobacterium sp. PH31-L1]|uniref:LamG-like jellyroll fold domain-containing protein n=1 Tax=Cryobacterium sp. PH31-L1 TaxID=3046199 RepID=UPI0024BADA49|nr:LamG-like jellyroll fold domain-containing protein [Cryobacterium sp. PH31-L1]MDJ0376193.1 LamG domain-containing protein [Cryobacterium sp. PH31-L1]
MTPARHRKRLYNAPSTRTRRWRLVRRLIAVPLAFAMASGVAWAYWSAGSVDGSSGASAASSVNAGPTPTATSASSTVTVTWAASTLADGTTAVSGYSVSRFDSTGTTAQLMQSCTGTIAATSCTETGVPAGSWSYRVTALFATNWKGAASAKSNIVIVDTTAPVNWFALSSGTTNAYKSGSTIYYRGALPGSFTLTNSVTDVGSGPASSSTAALGGTSTGWSHDPSTVSTPTSGPYVSAAFTWAAGTTSSPTETVTARDVATNTTPTTLTYLNDASAPTGGAPAYTAGYQPGRAVYIDYTGSDAGSGVATQQLQRKQSSLSGGMCGSYGAWVNMSSSVPTASYTDTSVAAGLCYIYQYVVTDRVGNTATFPSSNVALIDYAGAVAATSGIVGQWRLGEAAGTGLSSDSFTGPAGYLKNHLSEQSVQWTELDSTDSRILGGRAMRVGIGYSLNYLPISRSSANYAVEADLYNASTLAGDVIGLVSRMNTSSYNLYAGGWFGNADGTGAWRIAEASGGNYTLPSSATSTAQSALVVGETYRLRLEVSGTSSTVLNLYVNGVLKASYTDTSSPTTPSGVAGFIDGIPENRVTKTTSTGLQLDHFEVIPLTYPRIVPSVGSNVGDYLSGPTLGAAGIDASRGGTNTAATFDGVADYGSIANPVSSAFSIELWFKSTQGLGSGCTAWSQGAGLVDASSALAPYGFGISLCADGYVLAGTGTTTVRSPAGGYDNNAWHHVVLTRASNVLVLYVDGVSVTSSSGTTASLASPLNINLGRLQTGTNYFAGTLDEISVYGTALSAATVNNHFQLGNSPAADIRGPSGGSVALVGLTGTGSAYSTATSLSLTLNPGTDASGLASGAHLDRATATLSSSGTADGTCGTMGSFALVATDPAASLIDRVTSPGCYQYRYVVLDTSGNSTTYTSAVVKVDSAAPSTPTFSSFAASASTNSYWSSTTGTVYYRSGQTSGSFTATASATDTVSGVKAYNFTAPGTNWTSSGGGTTGVNTYVWSGTPSGGGASVTATNNAGLTSGSATFTLTPDNTAPSGGTVTSPNGATTSTSVAVSFAAGSDVGSGIGKRTLERGTAKLSGSACGSYAYSTVLTIPPGVSTTTFTDKVSSASCYTYRLVIFDTVGNSSTVTNSSVLQVKSTYSATVLATSGLVSYWRLGDAASSPTFVDSQAGQTGTFTGSPVLGSAGALAGDPDTAAYFGGSAYGRAPHSLNTDFSIELWLKSVSSKGSTCQAWSDGTAMTYTTSNGGNLRVGVSLCAGQIIAGSNTNNSAANIVSATGYNDGEWHHVVFTRAGAGSIVLYVDGAAVKTLAGPAGTPTTTTLNFAGSSSNTYVGTLDEIAVYNTVLSADTVAAHQAAGR